MAGRPTAAFLLSLAGGALTLAVGATDLLAWRSLYSQLGPGFRYDSLGLGSVPSGEALGLFVVGTLCGIVIVAGAVLQCTGGRSNVRVGSTLVLAGLVLGIPTTYAGQILGGVLCAAGALLGLAWRPSGTPRPGAPA